MELDSIVHRLFGLISTEIDCTACDNCCREVSLALDKEDIESLSYGFGTSIDQFRLQKHREETLK